MAFFGTSSPAANADPADAKSQKIKQDIQNQISQELAVANATELVNKITDNCFEKCISQPGSMLSNGEEGCINQCLQKYMRSWNVISKAYIARIQESSGLL